MLLKSIENKLVEPIKSTMGMCPSHLLYADNVIVFCKASRNNVKTLQKIIKDYRDMSGQRVNKDKSSLFFGKGTPQPLAKRICDSLEVNESLTPFVYLGVPIFFEKAKRHHLRASLDKIIMRFATWKGCSLSFMGRLALVKFVIYGTLLHSFMVYQWLISLLKELERNIRNFIWSGNVLNTSHKTVSWDKCCKPLSEGGLGFQRPRDLNRAIVSKLAFKIIANKDMIHDFLRERFLRKGKMWG